jgi:hypothetical protein
LESGADELIERATLTRLIEQSAAPLASLESAFAVDNTGFSTSVYRRWYDANYGRASSPQPRAREAPQGFLKSRRRRRDFDADRRKVSTFVGASSTMGRDANVDPALFRLPGAGRAEPCL